jgi:hypothetical protein
LYRFKESNLLQKTSQQNKLDRRNAAQLESTSMIIYLLVELPEISFCLWDSTGKENHKYLSMGLQLVPAHLDLGLIRIVYPYRLA